MKQIRLPFSNTQSLAAQWRALMAMAIALGRQILGLQQTHPRRALQQAEMLEVWCVMALAEVSRQIAADGPAAHARKKFSEQLPPIAAVLMMMLVFIKRVKAQLLAQIAKQAPARDFQIPARAYARPIREIPFIDTS